MGKFLYLGPKAELRLFGEDAPTVRRVRQLVGVVYIRRPKCPDDTSTNLKRILPRDLVVYAEGHEPVR